MRTTLLWMARNGWMKEHLPKLPFARKAVRRFMPGEQVEDAIAAADRLDTEGFGVLFTHLGENITELAEADAVAAHYHDVLERSRERALAGARPIEISVKPTQLGLDVDEAVCLAHCEDLARHAEETGTWFWLDMEGSDYTERTIALYERLKRDHPKVGIALQAYLKRTAADVERLLPLEPCVRLVKGAYDEPAIIAFRSRVDVDWSYETLAVRLARAAGEGKARLCLGTHDSALIERRQTILQPAPAASRWCAWRASGRPPRRSLIFPSLFGSSAATAPLSSQLRNLRMMIGHAAAMGCRAARGWQIEGAARCANTKLRETGWPQFQRAQPL